MTKAQEELTKEEAVWERYGSVPKILTPEYINSIPWEKLGGCPSDDFAKALMIASDVETATYDIFFLRQLAGTPSERDPIIAKFMKRWVPEELTHGEILRKILNLWGHNYNYETPNVMSWSKTSNIAMQFFSNCFPNQFKALHMLWGGINELTARETYRRLRESTADPVLRMVLAAIIKEESLHANFYLGMAELKINSRLTRLVCRRALRGWKPVGAWNKTDCEMLPVFALFANEHLTDFDRNVTKEFERRFPVFTGSGLTEILETMINSASQ